VPLLQCAAGSARPAADEVILAPRLPGVNGTALGSGSRVSDSGAIRAPAPQDRSRSSISHAWSSMCQAQRRIKNWTVHHDPAAAPRALVSRMPAQTASRWARSSSGSELGGNDDAAVVRGLLQDHLKQIAASLRRARPAAA
jgi:hypothetical protein